MDVFYNGFFVNVMNGNLDLDTDTIKVALVTSTYSPDIDAHDAFDDITNEVTGTGYTAGGNTITNAAVTQDNTNDRGVFDGDNVSWPSSSITARGAVMYKDSGTAATSYLIMYLDFGTDQTSNSGTFEIQWDAVGILTQQQQ